MMNKDLVGQTLLKQFRVDAFVESGGMAAVYRVWDLRRNVPLAMKVLHADLADEPAVLRRFQREANALKKLMHPHIVPFYGMYQTSHSIFLLERFVDGFSLKDILRKQRGKSLGIADTLTYLKALCAALGYAHANGMVHCDVKPGNVMIDLSGSIYLTDFGVARYSESTTTSFGTAGTPAYMAPEQIRGETVSGATDVYALGVLSFELLTGQRPFRGSESSTQRGGVTANERVRYGHLNVPPPNPRSINPELSVDIANVVLRSLNKKPADRFQSTQEFFEALCIAAAVSVEDVPDRVTLMERPVSIIRPYATEGANVGPVISQPLPNIKKNPPFVMGVLLLGFLVLGILGISFGRIFSGLGSALGGPTETSHPSATATLTASPAPSPTLIPTITPAVAWSNRSIVDSSENRPGPFLSAGTDSNGKYYVAFFRDISDQLMVVEGDGVTWKPLRNLQQINREGKLIGLYVTLEVKNDGLPFLSYWIRDRGQGKVSYLTNNGSWSIATIRQNLDIYDMRSVLDSSDVPHYVVLTKFGDVSYGSNLTNLVTVDSGALPPKSMNIKHDYFPVAVAVDTLQNPHICYSKSEKIQCKHKRGESWESTSVPGSGFHPSLQADERGNLHLAFYDHEEKTLKYAFLPNNSSSWKVDDVDLTTNTGQYPSLMVDSNGWVHISYYDEGNSALKYAIGKLGGWSKYTVDNAGDVGLISCLVIDSQNNPAIAYYDAGRKQIFFVVREK